MVWRGVHVRRWLDLTTTPTRQSEFFTPLADAIVAMNTDWSITQNVIYDTTQVALVLDHVDGSQICFHTGTSAINAGNCYNGTTSEPEQVWVAYNPTYPAGTWATIDGTTNPKDTATWCSAASSMNFFKMDVYSASDAWDSAYLWDFYVLVDDLNANVACYVIYRGSHTPFAMMDSIALFGNDTNGVNANDKNFIDMDDDTDDYMAFGLYLGVADQLDAGTAWSGQVFTSGTLEEYTVYCMSDVISMVDSGAQIVDTFTADRAILTRAVANGGRKGIIDDSFLVGICYQTQLNFPLDSGQKMHWTKGLCTAWATQDLGQVE